MNMADKDSFSIKEMLIIVMEKQDETIAHVKETNGKVAAAFREIEANKTRINKLENDAPGIVKRLTSLENWKIKVSLLGAGAGVVATLAIQYAFKHFFG